MQWNYAFAAKPALQGQSQLRSRLSRNPKRAVSTTKLCFATIDVRFGIRR